MVPAYEIIPLIVGRIFADKGMMTYFLNYGQPIALPVVFWYIKGGDKKILVDSGATSEIMNKIWHGGSEDIRTFEDALRFVDLMPDDIDIIIQTHLHFDHCANSSKCKNAKIVVQEEELRFAYQPHPLIAAMYSKELFQDLKFVTVKGDAEILPGIKVVHVPGHAPGSQAVSVDTAKGKAVISGFCCTSDVFDVPKEMKVNWPVITPGIHCDALKAFDSAMKVKGIADILIPQHEIKMAGLKSIPGDGTKNDESKHWE